MALLSNMQLKQRLVLMSLATTGIALLVAGMLTFLYELMTFRNSLVRDISIKSDIIGGQCSAALLFNVQKDAEETLGALRADRHIVHAAVYTKDGSVFAVYRRGGARESDIPPSSPGEGHSFGIDRLDLFHPIMLHGERIGTVYIRSDLDYLRSLLAKYVGVAGAVLALSLLVAYALVSKFQRSITAPLADLVRLMEKITQDEDFSLRADVARKDELGSLASGFNEMLINIQERDRELDRRRRRLEDTVADLRKSTAELREANKKLKELDKLKSDFISVVSHELRTPLTSIKAFIELILMKPDMNGERKSKLLRIINSESDRLARLINDMLDLAKIESGTLTWQFAPQSIEEIVRTSVDSINPLADNKGLRITTSVEPGLPVFLGDRDRLLQVMTNILSNAVKFTPEGGGIAVKARRENDSRPHIEVSVSDSGVGISDENLKRIFDKFHRSGDSLADPTEGTGLGLAIARQIVEYHGGAIWAESAVGKGSTFTFTIPIERNEEMQEDSINIPEDKINTYQPEKSI